MAIGLIFLLPAEDQRHLLTKLADTLKPGGTLLFSAPRQRGTWRDTLTGRISLSLGADDYARHLEASGLLPVGEDVDEGGNDYFNVVKPV